jgi:hypothetical protein
MKEDKAFDPADIGFFRTDAHMLEPQDMTYLIEQLGFRLHETSSGPPYVL